MTNLVGLICHHSIVDRALRTVSNIQVLDIDSWISHPCNCWKGVGSSGIGWNIIIF